MQHPALNGNGAHLRTSMVPACDAEHLVDLAAVALRGGHHEQAIDHAGQALSLMPGHALARFTLAFGLLGARRDEQAAPVLRGLADDRSATGLAAQFPALAQAVSVELARLDRAAGLQPVLGPQTRLPLAARFDLLVKLLYVLHRRDLLPAWVTVDVPTLYARHIQLRTGGVEPGDPARKPTLDAYRTQFDALIDDLAANGFDAAQPVRLSAVDGLPCDGAHRMATALALGLPAAIERVPTPGWRWDMAWFQQHGFGHEDINVLLRTWLRLRGDEAALALLWSPLEEDWPSLERSLSEHAEIVGARTIELPRAGFEEMVRDVYSLDAGPRVGTAIENKIRLLRAYPPRLRLVWIERRADGSTPAAPELKRLVRERFDARVPASWFVTLHLSDSAAELRHLAAIFASEHNLALLRRRSALPDAFVQRLVELRDTLAAHGLGADDVCVVGGSVLAALGLRPSDDVDITLTTEQRMAHFDAGITKMAPGVDLVTQQYARSFSSAPAPTDDRLIASPASHFVVRGYRFASPDIVRTRKQHQRRDKDLRDLPLLADFATA